MDAIQLVRARMAAFQREWAANPLVPVVAESAQALEGVLRRNVEGSHVTLARLGRFGNSSVVVAHAHPVRSVDLDVTLWVQANYTNYAAAYREFLRAAYKLPGRPTLPNFDIDHLLNRKRSQLTGLWVRLEACPSVVNQAWGRTFERHASDPAVHANNTRPRRTACYGIAAKMAGLMPPTSLADQGAITKLCSHFRSVLPRDEPDPCPGVRDYLNRIYGHDWRVVVAVVDAP